MPMLVALGLSHCFVLLYDHIRVIRVTEFFYWADSVMERSALALMVIPACFILCTLLFYAVYVFQPDADPRLAFGAVLLGFFVHGILHMKILLDVLPWAAKVRFKATSGFYKKVAREEPANYFSCNPVHVLRSRYVLKHDPPVCYYTLGKEHCMWQSPQNGMHYKKRPEGKFAKEPEDIYDKVKARFLAQG